MIDTVVKLHNSRWWNSIFPLLLPLSFLFPPLKVGSLNRARECGEHYNLPSRVRGEAQVKIEFGAFQP